MSHAQSLLFPCLTSSAHSTCTPNPTSLLFPSHGDDHCDQPRHGATCVQLAESKLPTSYEPYDLAEMNNTEITPIFFHRQSVTSTYEILLRALLLLLLNRIWTMSRYGTCFTTLRTGERSKCRSITSFSLLQRKLCDKFISCPSKCGETCSCVLSQ